MMEIGPHAFPKRKHPDREKGYYLIEAVISVLIVGIICAGMADGYAKIRAFGVGTQTELQAIAISQECIDQLRATQFRTLYNYTPGTYTVPIVGTDTGGTWFPRPLLRDTALSYYNWQTAGNYTVAGSPLIVAANTDDTNNYLKATNNAVTVTLSWGANNTVDATVSLTWSDGMGKHTYDTHTTIANNGLAG